jgi:hypothetical protein
MATDKRTVLMYVGGGAALVALLVLAPLFFASGLMAPGWAVGVFIGVWVVLFALGVVWMIMRRPLRVLPLPVLAAIVWFGGMSAGGALLGWTA